MRVCPICGQYKLCNRHHRYPRAVWGNSDDIIWLCLDCHQALHDEIRQKENLILRQYPEIYIGTLESLIRRKNDARRTSKRNAKNDRPNGSKHYPNQGSSTEV